MYYRALIFLIFGYCFLAIPVLAQQSDTLSGVTLFAVRPAQQTTSGTLSLTLNSSALKGLNSYSVAEAATFLPGIQVKDYGGIGGLKTVSLRSLGANYTTVLYNGMVLSDAQGGQIDLGSFSLNNTNAIEYTLNSPASMLAPAKAFANAAVINIIPNVDAHTNGFVGKAGLRIGSFGLFNPFATVGYGISSKTLLSISGDWETANGHYRYKDYEHGGNSKTRIDAGISAFRIETSLHHQLSDSGYLLWQNYIYHANRGLPGAVILYTSPNGDKLLNTSFFSQLQYKSRWSKSVSILLSARYAKDNKDYTDPDYPNSAGMLENFFRQQSLYGSAAVEWKISGDFRIHYAADFTWEELKRTDSFAINYASPQRKSVVQNAGINFLFGKMNFQADLLHNLIDEVVKTGLAGKTFRRFSPSVSLNVKPGTIPLHLRGSFKYLNRYPTFDELYFTNIGNTSLKPELARLYSVGALGEFNLHQEKLKMSWSVDGYYQYVTDKILAIPRQNLFQWSMMNIGKAAISGIDAGIFASLLSGKLLYSAGINYSLQNALDLTDPASIAYKKLLAYSAMHSGTFRGGIQLKKFRAGYNLFFTGKRYRAGGELGGDRLPPFSTHDVNISCAFNRNRPFAFDLRAEANNIFNQQYEIIRYFPMPGFNFRFTLIVTYKHTK